MRTTFTQQMQTKLGLYIIILVFSNLDDLKNNDLKINALQSRTEVQVFTDDKAFVLQFVYRM